MEIGLYSITYLGIWYDGPGLTFEELVRRAKTIGYAGIELDGKRPHGREYTTEGVVDIVREDERKEDKML